MRLLAAIIGVTAILAIVIALRPAAFTVQRRIWIAAAPDDVFALLDNFRDWSSWSPYEKQDPAMRTTITGTSGVGSSMHYSSRKLGEGRMTVIERRPNELLGLRAEFIKPFTATNRLDFTLVRERGGTSLTWAMSGHNTFFFKAFDLVANCDRMVGRDFEVGLAYIKRLSEVRSAQRLTPANDV